MAQQAERSAVWHGRLLPSFASRQSGGKPARRPKINRGALPPQLPREEVVLDLADKSCACCGGLKVFISEDVSERLDVVPAQFKVIVTRPPKYACRACQGEVAQAPAAPAPEHLIEKACRPRRWSPR